MSKNSNFIRSGRQGKEQSRNRTLKKAYRISKVYKSLLQEPQSPYTVRSLPIETPIRRSPHYLLGRVKGNFPEKSYPKFTAATNIKIISFQLFTNAGIDIKKVTLPFDDDLNEIKNYQLGWDGYDAPPIPNSVIQKARKELLYFYSQGIKPDLIAPNPQEGIVVEYETKNGRFVFRFFPDKETYTIWRDQKIQEKGEVLPSKLSYLSFWLKNEQRQSADIL